MPLRKASVDQFSLMMMNTMVITYVAFSGSSLVALQKEKNIIQLSSEGEVNSSGYSPNPNPNPKIVVLVFIKSDG